MIGIFNDNFPPVIDGVATTARNYAYWLHVKGDGACVITPKSPDQSDIIAKEPYPIIRYPSIPIPMRKPYRFGLPDLDVTLKTTLADMNFTLLHAHCPFSSGLLAKQIARKKHIPLVATFHSKYRDDLIRAVPSDVLVDNEIKRIVHFYEHADEVWIPQAAVEATLRQYGYQGAVTVVENGNDMATPVEEIAKLREKKRAELGIEKGEVMFLFVGQHIWEKNIGFILDALALMKDLPFHFYTIGTGYALEGIREKIAALGLQDKVTLEGVIIDRDELKRYYAAADLFLFPSLYDNAPVVVREAAAMHTPSAMLQGSTASEVIRDGENGFLSPNDVVVYAELLRHLVQHPEERELVGNGAAATLARSWENIIDEVILRYRDIELAYKKKHPRF